MTSDLPNYLTVSVILKGDTALNLSDSFLDCRGFTVSTGGSLFGSLESVSLLNCAFEANIIFALSVRGSSFTNCSISSKAESIGALISGTMESSNIIGLRLTA